MIFVKLICWKALIWKIWVARNVCTEIFVWLLVTASIHDWSWKWLLVGRQKRSSSIGYNLTWRPNVNWMFRIFRIRKLFAIVAKKLLQLFNNFLYLRYKHTDRFKKKTQKLFFMSLRKECLTSPWFTKYLWLELVVLQQNFIIFRKKTWNQFSIKKFSRT